MHRRTSHLLFTLNFELSTFTDCSDRGADPITPVSGPARNGVARGERPERGVSRGALDERIPFPGLIPLPHLDRDEEAQERFRLVADRDLGAQILVACGEVAHQDPPCVRLDPEPALDRPVAAFGRANERRLIDLSIRDDPDLGRDPEDRCCGRITLEPRNRRLGVLRALEPEAGLIARVQEEQGQRRYVQRTRDVADVVAGALVDDLLDAGPRRRILADA